MPIQEFENFLRQNVPMIDYSQLNIEQLDNNKCIIKMPFIKQNKNHLQSMYFGSILIGTEVSAGILAAYLLKLSGQNSNIIFKNVAGDFIRRAEADTYFICCDSEKIIDAINKARDTMERVNITVNVIGVTDLDKPDEKVSDFNITVSIKCER